MFTLTKNSTATFVAILLAAILAFTFVSPASAWGGKWMKTTNTSASVMVNVQNHADVSNSVSASASTGHNDATGGNGNAGGEGGEANGGHNGDSVAGDGGNGGHGAVGGTVMSGDATAFASAMNSINESKTTVEMPKVNTSESARAYRIDRTKKSKSVDVTVDNSASLHNTVSSDADTTHNVADGGNGGKAGNGGDANAARRSFWAFWDDSDMTMTMGGNGGHGGHGAMGGEVMSGEAISGSEVVNVLNHSITRVIR